jgi:hypothetical protein
MEKMLDQVSESAYDADEEPLYKCCYCRRAIIVDNYFLQLLARRLKTLSSCGYEVSNALANVKFHLDHGLHEERIQEESMSFEIYEIHDVYYVKKPKQGKRTAFKQRMQSKQRINVKQNIGGRRR